MRQLSLLDSLPALAGLMPSLRAAMRRAAGDPEGEGRKKLVDRINSIARQEEIQLTGGNVKEISKATLDKWLSATDCGHPPSLLAVLVFCRATGDAEPLRIMGNALLLHVVQYCMFILIFQIIIRSLFPVLIQFCPAKCVSGAGRHAGMFLLSRLPDSS